MAASPAFKVYSADNKYVAACKFTEDAAAVVALHDGGTVRTGHRKKDIFFTQGVDGDAADSYDVVFDAWAGPAPKP